MGEVARSFLSSGGTERKVLSWLTLDSDSAAFVWKSLEQRSGQPVEEGQLHISDIIAFRRTGLQLDVLMKNREITFAFDSAPDLEKWHPAMKLALDVLTTDSDKAALEAS